MTFGKGAGAHFIVAAKQGEITRAARAEMARMFGHALEGACFLDADDVADFGKRLHGFRRNIDSRAARHVIKQERHGDGSGNFFEMAVEAALRWLVVIGSDLQGGITAAVVGGIGEFDGFSCVEFAPAPAMTGMRFFAISTVKRVTALCSS